MHAALSPYGVIDFASNAASAAAADPLMSAMMPSGAITGGPPAYLEAHGIRYVPSMDHHLGSETSAYDPNPLLVPMMGDPDGSGPLESSPTGPAVYVSPHELNSRVDERIKRFMDMQQQAPLSAPAENIDARLRNLRRECEMAAQASGAGIAPRQGGAGSAARLRQLQLEASKAAQPQMQQPYLASHAAGASHLASHATGGRGPRRGDRGKPGHRYDY